jgi:hypothetical protein
MKSQKITEKIVAKVFFCLLATGHQNHNKSNFIIKKE